MGTEIERKFLVDPKNLPKPLPKGKKISQGYLCGDPVVRIRITDDGKGKKAFITIKGDGSLVRSEFEYPIPIDDGRRLLRMCGDKVVHKIRYRYGRWEVDRFLGPHAGLWLVECELKDRNEKPKAPFKLDAEVTHWRKFANVVLAGMR
jgi:adenylate cyclase